MEFIRFSAGDSNLNITSSNSTISTPANVGKSIMPDSTMNMILFLMSTMGIITIASSVTPVVLMYSWFFICYLISMLQITPRSGKIVTFVTPFVILICVSMASIVIKCSFLIKRVRNGKKLSRFHSQSTAAI